MKLKRRRFGLRPKMLKYMTSKQWLRILKDFEEISHGDFFTDMLCYGYAIIKIPE